MKEHQGTERQRPESRRICARGVAIRPSGAFCGIGAGDVGQNGRGPGVVAVDPVRQAQQPKGDGVGHPDPEKAGDGAHWENAV